MVDFLFFKKNKISKLDIKAFLDASIAGDTNIIQSLLDKKIDVNVKDTEKGTTALHHAAEAGHEQIVSILISAGTKLNLQASDGWTPLLSASRDHPEVVEILLKAGANPDIATPAGYTPLMRAAGHSKYDIAQLLIKAGANLAAEDENGKTALYFAGTSQMYNQETCDLLKEETAKYLLNITPTSGFKRILLDDMSLSLINLTRNGVGGKIRKLDLVFEDGSSLKNVRVLSEVVMELPVEHADKEVSSISVPLDQD